jgi:hypothetical protein
MVDRTTAQLKEVFTHKVESEKGLVIPVGNTSVRICCFHGHFFVAYFGKICEEDKPYIDIIKQAGGSYLCVTWDNVNSITSTMLWSIPSWQTPR